MAHKDPEGPKDGPAKRAPSRGLDTRSLELIGSSLKAHYEALVLAPVPEKFLQLLDELEANEHAANAGPKGDKVG